MFSAIDYNNQWEDQAKELILPSLDPGLARLGTVTASPDGDLRVNVILGTGAHPDRDSLNLSLQESLSALPWARNIQVKVRSICFLSKNILFYVVACMVWVYNTVVFRSLYRSSS